MDILGCIVPPWRYELRVTFFSATIFRVSYLLGSQMSSITSGVWIHSDVFLNDVEENHNKITCRIGM